MSTNQLNKGVNRSSWRDLYVIGGVSALLQLATLVVMGIAIAVLGAEPASAEEYFLVYQDNPVAGVLRGDFFLLILIGLYLGTIPAFYVALRQLSPVYSMLASLFSLIVVMLCFASESTFSLLYLGKLYTSATTQAQRAVYLAAGEAAIASDMWHSSGAYVTGILLQGAGVMFSVIMLRSKEFSKLTAYAGLIANGLDLIQHVLHPFTPFVTEIFTPVMGLFYVVWYPMLARDFLRLSRVGDMSNTMKNKFDI